MDSFALYRTGVGRRFPPVAPDPYRSDSSDAAGRWLAGASRPQFGVFQLYTGRGLDAAGRRSRLLMLHRLAFEAECEGIAGRADFLWREFHGYLKRLWSDQSVWAAGEPGLRHLLLQEVFIDTHCAFYNGRVGDSATVDPDDRAFVHSGWLAELADVAKMPEAEAMVLLERPARLRIESFKSRKQWDEAVLECEKLLGRFPSVLEFQDELSDLLLGAALKMPAGKESELPKASDLQRSIYRIEDVRLRYPHNPSFYRVLAHCHLMHAIRLANDGALSQALVAACWAQKCNPHLEEARRTEQQLRGLMDDLQAQMKAIQAELAAKPGTTLNEQGLRMQREASQGYGPLIRIEGSKEAAETLRMFHVATARRMWRDIGLADPDDRKEERAALLLTALTDLSARQPANAAEMAKEWRSVASTQPDLAALDPKPILAFLCQRLLGEAAPAQPAVHGDAPVLATKPQRAGASEPFAFWLLSRQDLRVKFQAVAAAVLITTTAGLYAKDGHQRSVREAAYRDAVAAYTAGENDRTMAAAERFLSAKTARADAREGEVRNIYDQAFSRWFVTAASAESPDFERTVERYRALAQP